MGRVWSSVGFQLFFGKQSILADHPPFTWQKIEYHVLHKDSDGNILTDENDILSRWREYFEDLLNPVKAPTRETHEVTHLGEDEVFTADEFKEFKEMFVMLNLKKSFIRIFLSKLPALLKAVNHPANSCGLQYLKSNYIF